MDFEKNNLHLNNDYDNYKTDEINKIQQGNESFRISHESFSSNEKFDEAMKNIAVHDRYLSKLTPNNLQKKIFDSQIAMTYVALGDMLIKDKSLTSKQFKDFCNNARDHLYDIDINDTELYEMSKNHKTIYKLLKKDAYIRLKLIFQIRKLLH